MGAGSVDSVPDGSAVWVVPSVPSGRSLLPLFKRTTIVTARAMTTSAMIATKIVLFFVIFITQPPLCKLLFSFAVEALQDKYLIRASSSFRWRFSSSFSSRHTGQPVELLERLWTWVHQECPFSHRHQTGILLVCAILSGVMGRFFSVSHSTKIRCRSFSSQ